MVSGAECSRGIYTRSCSSQREAVKSWLCIPNKIKAGSMYNGEKQLYSTRVMMLFLVHSSRCCSHFLLCKVLDHENAWALTHLPWPALLSSFAPKSFCHDGLTHKDQWIWFSSESAELQTDTHTYTGPILLPRPLMWASALHSHVVIDCLQMASPCFSFLTEQFLSYVHYCKGIMHSPKLCFNKEHMFNCILTLQVQK